MLSQRFLKYSLIILSVLGLLLLLAINRGLAGLANDFVPGAALWAHLTLMALEALALIWFWRGLFRRRHYLLIKNDLSPEEREAFARELIARLRDNRHLRESEPGKESGSLDLPHPDDPAYVECCLNELNRKANEEIKSTARRVFLGTALSQNGRLDGLIVFVSLCRMIWRISGIYNQRPHPKEIFSLYWTVVSTTFLALSFEELNLTTEITVGFGESLQATAPTAATNSLPFVGSALQTFTASAIDGAANCYLALRAGIIARNAYAYSISGEKRPGRAAVFREAGALLLGMSGDLMARLSKTLGGKFVKVARLAQDGAVHAGKSLVSGVGSGIEKVGEGLGDSVEWLADGTLHAVKSTGSAVAVTGRITGSAVAATGRAGVDAVKATGRVGADVMKATGDAVIYTGKMTGEAVKATGGALKKAGGLAVSPVAWAVGKAGRTIGAPFRSESGEDKPNAEDSSSNGGEKK